MGWDLTNYAMCGMQKSQNEEDCQKGKGNRKKGKWGIFERLNLFYEKL